MRKQWNCATPDISMGGPLVLGIDLGTSGVRVAVLNAQRELLFSKAVG